MQALGQMKSVSLTFPALYLLLTFRCPRYVHLTLSTLPLVNLETGHARSIHGRPSRIKWTDNGLVNGAGVAANKLRASVQSASCINQHPTASQQCSQPRHPSAAAGCHPVRLSDSPCSQARGPPTASCRQPAGTVRRRLQAGCSCCPAVCACDSVGFYHSLGLNLGLRSVKCNVMIEGCWYSNQM